MIPTRAATICCAFLFLAGVAMAKIKKFNVVSFGNDVKVSVNGRSAVQMKRCVRDQPLFSVELDVDDPVQYRYVQDKTKEDFERRFPDGRSETFNDFFGRQDTIKHFPELPRPFKGEKNGQWTRGMGQVNPYNETYIPTIHFTGKNALNFFKSPIEKGVVKDGLSVFFILQDETKLLQGVSLKAWKTQSPKFCIRMTLGGNDLYYGRNVFKFRYGESDPTLMREKLYTDILVAVGSPVHQTNLVRVYVSGLAVGLYIMQDESSDEKFLRTEFYGKGDAPPVMGIPIEGHIGADFQYENRIWSEGDPFRSFVAHAKSRTHHNHRKDASNERVVKLCRALHYLDPNDEKAVNEFDEKWFNIDIFFKAMVIEYATGHWDSYWGMTSNFALYDDPNESDPPNSYKFYFLDEDFEHTFGAVLSQKFNSYGRKFTKQHYKTLLEREWLTVNGKGLPNRRPPRRTMIEKLISTPELTERFEKILKKIFKDLFNPVGLFDRIDAMAARYCEEVKWDRTIKRLRSGKKDKKWTLEDFFLGVEKYPGRGRGPHAIGWALKAFIEERADSVAKDFGLDYRSQREDRNGEETKRQHRRAMSTQLSDSEAEHPEETENGTISSQFAEDEYFETGTQLWEGEYPEEAEIGTIITQLSKAEYPEETETREAEDSEKREKTEETEFLT